MRNVREQYEAYPYPERDPQDEKKRLITGSPSHPLEVDHFLFQGRRDWSKGTRILVAGGGTGDALIQLAQVLTSAGKPYEITYIDLSTASREIAEARAQVRGLRNIRFKTGSLLDAGEFGPFDYIDCCGVLHHLPEPQAGFDALAGALADGGGLGLMVYAPHGRSGVYPLQDAFGELLNGFAPKDRLKAAKEMFDRLPEGHPFRRNPHLVDHEQSDAGFYDLLLHSQDRPYTVTELSDCLAQAGLAWLGSPQASLYDLSRFTTPPEDMDALQQMALAEKLDGTIKLHVVYAGRADTPGLAKGQNADIPHLKGLAAKPLAEKIAKTGEITVTQNSQKHSVTIPKGAGRIIAGINGRRSLGDIQKALGVDDLAWGALWRPAERALTQYGLLLYSQLLR